MLLVRFSSWWEPWLLLKSLIRMGASTSFVIRWKHAPSGNSCGGWPLWPSFSLPFLIIWRHRSLWLWFCENLYRVERTAWSMPRWLLYQPILEVHSRLLEMSRLSCYGLKGWLPRKGCLLRYLFLRLFLCWCRLLSFSINSKENSTKSRTCRKPM